MPTPWPWKMAVHDPTPPTGRVWKVSGSSTSCVCSASARLRGTPRRSTSLEVEAAVGGDQFLERQGQAVQAEEVRRQEGRQPVALVLPEGGVFEQVAAG